MLRWSWARSLLSPFCLVFLGALLGSAHAAVLGFSPSAPDAQPAQLAQKLVDRVAHIGSPVRAGAWLADAPLSLPGRTADVGGKLSTGLKLGDSRFVNVAVMGLSGSGVLRFDLEADNKVPQPGSLLLAALALMGAFVFSRSTIARRLRGGLLLATAMGVSPWVQAADLSASVELVRGGLVWNRTTQTFDAQVVVRNRSTEPLLGPLKLVMVQATPAQVALYDSQGRTDAGLNYVLLPLPPNGLLEPGAQSTTTVRLLTYGQAVQDTQWRVEGQILPLARSAVVEVRAARAGGAGPVGAGYRVIVDGLLRGSTGADGRLLVRVPLDAQAVLVVHPHNEGGSAQLPGLSAGGSYSVNVLVDDGKEVPQDTRLRLNQLQQGLLPLSAEKLSLDVLSGEQTVRLSRLNWLDLVDVLGNVTQLRQHFSLSSEGSLHARADVLRQAAAGKGNNLRLDVSAEDAQGGVHHSSLPFNLGLHRVKLQLVAPPSNPGLPLAGVRVVVGVLDTDVRVLTQTDANGAVTLPDMPGGNLSLSASTLAGALTYRGVATAALSQDSLVQLTLLAPADLLAGVKPIRLLPLGPAVAPQRGLVDLTERAKRATLLQQEKSAKPLLRVQPLADPTSVCAVAFGNGQDVLMSDSAQLRVRKGSKKANLRFIVHTAEYLFVQLQSRYNDVWSVSVLSSSGEELYHMQRQINSQLDQEPVWRADGSTGEIKQAIDVAALAADADTTLVLQVTSVNIGDGSLPTTVDACLEASEPLMIKEVTPSTVPANNDGSFYSVPRNTETNTLQRFFTVAVSKPSGSTLTTLRLELRNVDDGQLMAVLPDVKVDADGVEVLEQDDTSAKLRVRVTVSKPSSSVNGEPPPTHDLAYFMRLKATNAQGAEISDEKTVTGKRALWRMPAGRARYGARDAGGDDWVARSTYSWLETHGALLNEIDDVSGEHGRNIGHAGHARGTDIDTYHFYRFPNATTGTDNYHRLANDTVAAFGALQANPPQAALDAQARVLAWLNASRTGLTALNNLDSVQQLRYCSGVATQGLPAGWCSDLLLTGQVTRSVAGNPPQTLVLGGAYAASKLRHDNGHNNHVHISLSAADIEE